MGTLNFVFSAYVQRVHEVLGFIMALWIHGIAVEFYSYDDLLLNDAHLLIGNVSNHRTTEYK